MPFAICANSSRLCLLASKVALFNCCCFWLASTFLLKAVASNVFASLISLSFSAPVFVADNFLKAKASSFILSAWDKIDVIADWSNVSPEVLIAANWVALSKLEAIALSCSKAAFIFSVAWSFNVFASESIYGLNVNRFDSLGLFKLFFKANASAAAPFPFVLVGFIEALVPTSLLGVMEFVPFEFVLLLLLLFVEATELVLTPFSLVLETLLVATELVLVALLLVAATEFVLVALLLVVATEFVLEALLLVATVFVFAELVAATVFVVVAFGLFVLLAFVALTVLLLAAFILFAAMAAVLFVVNSVASDSALIAAISFSFACSNKFAFSAGVFAVNDWPINAFASVFNFSDVAFKSCACLLSALLNEGFLASLSLCNFNSFWLALLNAK